jgi:hypothetical protein
MEFFPPTISGGLSHPALLGINQLSPGDNFRINRDPDSCCSLPQFLANRLSTRLS